MNSTHHRTLAATGYSIISKDMGATEDNTSHLNGRLANLNATVQQLTENLNVHKKEVQILRSEKETLDSVLTMKC